MISPACNWPGCAAEATRCSFACAVHWPLIPEKIRAEIGHASPRQGEEPSAYYVRAGAKASAWISRELAKPARGRKGGASPERLV